MTEADPNEIRIRAMVDAHRNDLAATAPIADVDRLLNIIDGLRIGMAYEALVIEAQTDGVKALGKSRSAILTALRYRLMKSARGGYAYYGVSYRALARAKEAIDNDPRSGVPDA